jgi:hypothetical protein
MEIRLETGLAPARTEKPQAFLQGPLTVTPQDL